LTDSRVALRGGTLTDGDAVLMSDLDLTVAPGELVAVVGPVASGKSLLMGALASLRPLSAGQLTLGGEDWHRLDRGGRRAAIGLVPQDPVIISTTIGDNIRLGREIDEQTLALALAVSQLDTDMGAFPQGLDTPLGERGMTLSGGQQRRLALARALVGRPSVLLLDDATAALDANTEAAFWGALERVLPDVAAVVVTHRTATIQRADRVVVLDDRRIVQVGTHDELIERPGPYRRIYGMFDVSEESWSGQFRI
jgi:ATP-binding cassette subfamily B protein